MLREKLKHGFPQAAWETGKEEARQAMIETARRGGVIAYSDLVKRIEGVRLEAHDVRLAHMLGEISSEEDEADRGMLTVVVVHKSGDFRPGPGFFELAKRLGRDTADLDACWLAELRRVHETWAE